MVVYHCIIASLCQKYPSEKENVNQPEIERRVCCRHKEEEKKGENESTSTLRTTTTEKYFYTSVDYKTMNI